ncbi:DUF1353 domain-containing protein [Schlesneria sp. T3-172]|uniref:DUF1353 domain-containing protein n=1 Tax=Schlesneria sphaerica TaxID=3373610 RepID=UPI0037C51E68
MLATGVIASGVLEPRRTHLQGEATDLGWGRFPEKPQLEFIAPQEASLLRSFVYIDPREKVWVAKKGDTTNGASIPRALWSIVGGPFEGNYLNASIVHDAACVEKSESSSDVHRMFYEACLCSGVEEKRARLLYAAVLYRGPRWYFITTASSDSSTIVRDVATAIMTTQEASRLESAIGDGELTLQEIESGEGMVIRSILGDIPSGRRISPAAKAQPNATPANSPAPPTEAPKRAQ